MVVINWCCLSVQARKTLLWIGFQCIKPRSRVERLPPSPDVKEPRVTAHYEHYAHDEWSIRDLLHWQNYPSLPITFPFFESRGVYIFKCSRPEYSWKIARWTLNTNQSIIKKLESVFSFSFLTTIWSFYEFIHRMWSKCTSTVHVH
jgi:hypothetical protein